MGRMTAFDYAVLGIVGLSVIVSIWRGVVRESIALASWVAAFFAAQAYAGTFAQLLPQSIPGDSARLLVAFVLVFLLVMVVAALIAIVISKLVRRIGLGPVDRGIGAIFGLVRGMLAVLILVLLGGLTSAPRHPVWREAMLSPPLEAIALAVTPMLPDALSRRISYE